MSRRAAGWLGMALFVSLLFNVFLGSVLVARLLIPDDDDGKRSRYSYTQVWQEMAETLPEPHRAEAVALWQQARERRGGGRAEARDALYEALVTEPFDADALQAAFAAMRDSSSARWSAYQAAILATAAHLPLERRQAYVAEQQRRRAEREARKKER